MKSEKLLSDTIVIYPLAVYKDSVIISIIIIKKV